ncbi:ArsR/SmtB family transcription factor [Mycolicibacterium arenosum]|uniref:Metalloregulator ArsR/SmtB family transcription factor n=1 Tax=Mycolicibacterium arenosum TaxID=2952157 RepID=A0ABT1M3P2_9MYCO|nr:metalloregulator ArsR/SmtB family transcription factor [Mycolicibacterium sp. CAU 1645]MCP9273769.1 metalloregulator ArsR/SmtB family transcription factor [Mycolicibacterium sp. CAU 1645]
MTDDGPRTDVPAVCSVLADETRWRILSELGRSDQSASALAARLPVSRQAIAKHIAVLAEAGLVESVRAGRELRYRAVGAQMTALADALDAIGRSWDRRLDAIKRIAEQPD